jgi:hypothetical protein
LNVDWLIPCRYAEVHDNLATIIGAGIDTHWVAELPVTVQVAMIARVQGLHDEITSGTHEIRQIITDPDGALVGELAAAAEFAHASGIIRSEWLQGIMLPIAVGFEAKQAGTYNFELMIDGAGSSVPLHVVLGQPGDAPAEPS